MKTSCKRFTGFNETMWIYFYSSLIKNRFQQFTANQIELLLNGISMPIPNIVNVYVFIIYIF